MPEIIVARLVEVGSGKVVHEITADKDVFHELVTQVRASLRIDYDVEMALSRKAFVIGDLQKCSEHYNRATDIHIKWLELGRCLNDNLS